MIGRGLNVSVPTIRENADALDRGGTLVRDRTFDLADVWEQLRTPYRAPEAPLLVGILRLLLVPHGQATAAVTGKVSTALHTFADEVEPIVRALEALASADQSDPKVGVQIDLLTYAFAQAEIRCSDAIRAAIGEGPRDTSLLPQFQPRIVEPGFGDYAAYTAEELEFIAEWVAFARGLRAGRIEGFPFPIPPEFPEASPDLPPIAVPIGGLPINGMIGVAPLVAPVLGVSPVAEIKGQYVPDVNNPDHRPPPEHIQVIDRDGTGRTPELNKPLVPDTRYVVDRGAYVYETDDQGRVVHAEGRLDTQYATDDQVRSPYRQRTVPGKLTGDQGGHLIAAQFDGPAERINLVPQATSANQQFLALETDWQRAVQNHQQVRVKIDIAYPDGTSKRPSGFDVGSVTSASPDRPDFAGQQFSPRTHVDNPVP